MRNHSFRPWIILIVAALATYGAAHPVSAQQQGQIVADSGFRPESNGFGFQNYGNENGVVNLTSIEMQRLFGDSVCAMAKNSDGTCTLTPPAQEWMDKVSSDMNGGHCDGMAALSSVIYYKYKNETPDNFGADQTAAIALEGNEALQREVALWWATQTTQPGNTRDIKDTPAKIVEILTEGFKSGKETYTVGIFQPDGSGGHSITPYAVQDQGNGVFWIMVYDNNFPREERHVEVDTTANTWTYFTAADPKEPGSEYRGDATTLTLSLTPDSARLEAQQCPFCAAQTAKAGGLALAAPAFNEIWLTTDSKPESTVDLLITDDQGHRLGYADGKLVNEIQGANYALLKSAELWRDQLEPVYYVPVGVKFSVTVDGSKLKQPAPANLAMIGPRHSLSIDSIKVEPGEKDVVTFSPDGTQLSYKPGGTESPDLVLGVEETGADYEFTVKGVAIEKGAEMNVTLEADKGLLSVKTVGGSKPAIYALNVLRLDQNASQEYYHDGLELAPGATVNVDYGKWDGKGDLGFQIDQNSDGKVDQSVTEPNQPKK